jgi:CDP-glycerol glycerophosphotransferase (TagB/SpsB family)
MNKKLTIFFDVQELYYLPQYLPVFKQLQKDTIFESKFIFHHGKFDDVINKIIADECLPATWVQDKNYALKFYLSEKPDWIFLGNTFPELDKIHINSKTAQLGHGVGPKKSYYSKSDTPTTVRFVESDYRFKRLCEMYPEDNFQNVGFCKMDPIINGEEKGIDFKTLGLDSNKKTILYAPTFYPSSIERFSKNFPDDLENYNIIIKPHFFSMSKKKYFKQRELLHHWESFDNTYLAKVDDYSLLPFLKSADLMISDASSAIIEFAALNKPVLWCTFLQLRWNYRGIFSYRFKARMDKDYDDYGQIAEPANSYNEMIVQTKNLLDSNFSLSNNTKEYLDKLAGILDGNSSKRIVTFLLENC